MRHKTTQTQQNLINNGEKGRLQEKQSKVHSAQHESYKSSRENIFHRLEMKAEMQQKSLFLFFFFLFSQQVAFSGKLGPRFSLQS